MHDEMTWFRLLSAIIQDHVFFFTANVTSIGSGSVMAVGFILFFIGWRQRRVVAGLLGAVMLIVVMVPPFFYTVVEGTYYERKVWSNRYLDYGDALAYLLSGSSGGGEDTDGQPVEAAPAEAQAPSAAPSYRLRFEETKPVRGGDRD